LNILNYVKVTNFQWFKYYAGPKEQEFGIITINTLNYVKVTIFR